MTVPRRALHVTGLALFAIAGVSAIAWPFTVDDAFIVARYADSLAAGEGWAMNPGEPTDGVTSPAWLLPMALAAKLGVDPIGVAKGLGLGCALFAAGWVVLRAARRAGGRIAAPVTAAFLVVQPNLGIWAIAGLETAAATLALTAACLLATEPRQLFPRPPVYAGLGWVRPEAVVAGVVPVVWLWARDRRHGAIALAAAALGVAALIAFRVAMFGHVLPLSFHAKPGDPAMGVPYVLGGAVAMTGALGIVPVLVAIRRGRREARLIGATLGVHVLVVALVGGDWMPGFRLLVPAIPLYALLAGMGTAELLRTRDRRQRALAVACVLAGLAVPAADLAVQLPEARGAGITREREGRAIARHLREHAASAAMVDVGYLAWASGVRVVDLGGLTDPRVARAEGGHVDKEIDPAWLAARDPDVIVLHSAVPPRVGDDGNLETLAGFPVERRVAAMGLVRERYRVDRVFPYAPGYWYVVLRRR